MMTSRTVCVLTLLAAVMSLASPCLGRIYTTVNGLETEAYTLDVGDAAILGVVSDDFAEYTVTLTWTEGPQSVLMLTGIMPEAGHGAWVDPFGGGFRMGAYDVLDPFLPAPGVHFVFEYTAYEPGLMTFELRDSRFRLLSTVSFMIEPAPSIDPERGLIGYWPLDASTGLMARDASGRGQDGVLGGDALPVWRSYAGRIGGALQFEGAGHVDCGPQFEIHEAMSVAAWVKMADAPAFWMGILTKGTEGWSLYTSGAEGRFAFGFVGGAQYHGVVGLTAIDPGEWHHVCGVFDGDFVRLFVDGQEDLAGPVAYSGYIDWSSEPVWMGGNSSQPDRAFLGLLDEVAIWDRPLNGDEIQWLYGDGVGNAPLARYWYVDDDAPGDPGPHEPAVSDPLEDGSVRHPFDSIQEAIDAAFDGDTLLVLDGSYAGDGNRNISFRGKRIAVRSQNGPTACIVDGQGAGRGFEFTNHETAESILQGLTITNGMQAGQDYAGGGILCVGSSPVIMDCVLANNSAGPYGDGGGICTEYGYPTLVNCMVRHNTAPGGRGGGIYCGFKSGLQMTDCVVSYNSPDGICMDWSYAQVFRQFKAVANDLVGDGAYYTDADTVLSMDNVRTRCGIYGPGTIQTSIGQWFSILSNATVDLSDPLYPEIWGSLLCAGLLNVADNGRLSHVTAVVNLAQFQDNSQVTNNTVMIPAAAPHGQVVVKDAASFTDNIVAASGDRYIDYHPAAFTGVIARNQLYITIPPAAGGRALFELRGIDAHCHEPNCPPGVVPVEAVPAFDTNSWTLERLEIMADASLSLTNRFDYHSPYDAGGDTEVGYVRELVMGPNAVLNTAYHRLYVEHASIDPTARVVNRPVPVFDLDAIDFSDPNSFGLRILHNNYSDPDRPFYGRLHIQRMIDVLPDRTGMMRMQNLPDLDPLSETYGQMVRARAKGLFAKTSEDEIVVQFQYLFERVLPGTELVVYLSDTADMLGEGDPLRAEHYIEIGRILAPPAGRPGALDSGRFGSFQERVSVGGLDFSNGLWVELELVEPGSIAQGLAAEVDEPRAVLFASSGSSVLIDNWNPAIICYGICLDINWDASVDEADYMTVIGECGHTAVGDRSCVDGVLSPDGYVDTLDIISWDWAMSDPGRVAGYCGVPLAPGEGPPPAPAAGLAGLISLENLPGSLDDLLIIGKRGSAGAANKYRDRLYVFDSAGACWAYTAPPSERNNIRIVRGSDGTLYAIHCESGIVRLNAPVQTVVPTASLAVSAALEPRYGEAATVYIGIQEHGADVTGRPILDAEFINGYAYIVPVVVRPTGKEAYLAAARLQLLSSGSPPYAVSKLYDDPPPAGDNRHREGLREIEVDAAGNVYVINSGSINESDTLWRFKINGTIERLELGNAHQMPYVPSPVAMHMSEITDTLYVGRGHFDPDDMSSSWVYGLNTTGALSLTRSVKITAMAHISSMDENPLTGSLWVAGFNMDSIPEYPNPYAEAFYKPRLVEVPIGAVTAAATSLWNTVSHDLALPMAVLWTGPTTPSSADLDGDGKVTFKDLVMLAAFWEQSCLPPSWCGGADLDLSNRITPADLAILAEQWLNGATP